MNRELVFVLVAATQSKQGPSPPVTLSTSKQSNRFPLRPLSKPETTGNMGQRHGKSFCLPAFLLLLIRSDFRLDRAEASSFHDGPDPAFTYTMEVDYSSDAEDVEESLLTVLESELVVQEIASPNNRSATLSHGGGAPSISGCFVTTRAFLWDNMQPFSMDFKSFVDSDDDDDDDENDDDGHSSMLSNMSIRRSSAFMAGKMASNIQSAKKTALLLRGGSVNFVSKGLSSEMSKKLFVTALVTLVFEGSVGHVLEFLKISLQTAQTETSYLRVMRDITSEKGIAGLWDGMFKDTWIVSFAHTA